jgi:hypothetical protein
MKNTTGIDNPKIAFFALQTLPLGEFRGPGRWLEKEVLLADKDVTKSDGPAQDCGHGSALQSFREFGC